MLNQLENNLKTVMAGLTGLLGEVPTIIDGMKTQLVTPEDHKKWVELFEKSGLANKINEVTDELKKAGFVNKSNSEKFKDVTK